MTNEVRGEIAADFDGKKINLILTTNAMCAVEAEEKRRAFQHAVDFGFPLDQVKPRKLAGIVTDLGNGEETSIEDVRLIFWGMMLGEKPDATDADAGRLIDGLRGQHDRIMIDAITAAFPEANEVDGSPEK